jgi:type IV secretion system protein VirB10
MNTGNGNDQEQAAPPETQENQSRSFRLRAEHPRVTRLSRKVLAGGSAVALLVIGGAVLWSLQNNRHRNSAADELYSTDHHNVADGISALPKDYAGIPRQPIPQLGPPLPGDLGRPILAAQGQSPTIGADPEQQRRDQETEAARISSLRPMGEKCVSPRLQV